MGVPLHKINEDGIISAKLHFPYFNGYVFLIIRDIVSHSSISIILFTSFNNLFL